MPDGDFVYQASLRLVESGYKIMSKIAVKSAKTGYKVTLTDDGR